MGINDNSLVSAISLPDTRPSNRWWNCESAYLLGRETG
jgi:hypothetical protein